MNLSLVLVLAEEPPAELDDALRVADELVGRRREVPGAPQHDDVLVLDPVLFRQRHEAVAERRVPDKGVMIRDPDPESDFPHFGDPRSRIRIQKNMAS